MLILLFILLLMLLLPNAVAVFTPTAVGGAEVSNRRLVPYRLYPTPTATAPATTTTRARSAPIQ